MLHGLDLVLIEVPSVAALRDFYINTLGFELELDGQQFIQLRRPGADGASLALSESADAKPTSNPQMWWYVDDADATCAELAQRGVQIGEQPHDCRSGVSSASTTPPAIRSTCWSCARSFPIGNGAVP